MVSFDEPVENAWMRSRGRCECCQSNHGHNGRCNCELVWEQRGRPFGEGAWESYRGNRVITVEWEATQQCRILCWSCYTETVRVRAAAAQPKTNENPLLAIRNPYGRLIGWRATA